MRSSERTPPGGDPVTGSPPASPAQDDRTTRARIRDAAIARFAREGISATSVRAVAADAGVAPSHVIHYFGSKAGLRQACDEHVAATIRAQQAEVVGAGAGLDPLAALRRTGGVHLEFLARTLVEPGPGADALIDLLVADAETYLSDLTSSGVLRHTQDPRGRAVLLTFWSLGTLALHHQLERVIGVRITDPDPDEPAFAGYAAAMLALVGPGLLDPAMADRLQATMTPAPSEEDRR